jgi:hypothetical protein
MPAHVRQLVTCVQLVPEIARVWCTGLQAAQSLGPLLWLARTRSSVMTAVASLMCWLSCNLSRAAIHASTCGQLVVCPAGTWDRTIVHEGVVIRDVHGIVHRRCGLW